jgi:hypothetical protein
MKPLLTYPVKLYNLRRIGLLGFLLFFVVLSGYSNQEARRIPAFPGAEGGGRYTTGGRGGQVIRVTNLNDSGPGSFREALNTRGPRTVVFDVAGNINLQSRIRIRHGDLTIAGQTAPGGGITIKGHEIRIAANNVIIRFLRFRPGDIAGEAIDAIMAFNVRDLIIDHCSLSWGIDEVASFYDNENFTLQWTIISESLNNSLHPKGAHGYAGIWGGKNASFLNNIIAHHHSRNPRLNGTRENPPGGIETTELINNLIYNWGDKAIYGGEGGQYIIANNIFISGPGTRPANRDEILEVYSPAGRFFVRGNVLSKSTNRMGPAGWRNITVPDGENPHVRLQSPFYPNNLHLARRPQLTYELLLRKAGASLSRDAIDLRIINEIKERTYTYGSRGIIDSQTQTGGWPVLNPGTVHEDIDHDGIADQWELEKGLNPRDEADGNSFTLSPDYTNLEMYLNHLVEKTLKKNQKF